MARVSIATALVLTLGLAACQDRSASAPSGRVGAATRPPAEQDTCWRINSGQPRFVAVARGVSSLENCAVFIEGLRLREHHDMNGVWNGVYIYADSQDLMTASGPDQPRFALFQPSDRARIDDSLTRQIAAQKSAPASSQP